MHPPTLLAEIDWRLKQRGTKELAARLENFFAVEKQNDFADWSLAEVNGLIDFLKQDEQVVMDFFLHRAAVSKKEFRDMIKKSHG